MIHLTALQKHAGNAAIVEFEMPFCVELEEGSVVGLVVLQVKIVDIWLRGGVAAFLTDVHFLYLD